MRPTLALSCSLLGPSTIVVLLCSCNSLIIESCTCTGPGVWSRLPCLILVALGVHVAHVLLESFYSKLWSPGFVMLSLCSFRLILLLFFDGSKGSCSSRALRCRTSSSLTFCYDGICMAIVHEMDSSVVFSSSFWRKRQCLFNKGLSKNYAWFIDSFLYVLVWNLVFIG